MYPDRGRREYDHSGEREPPDFLVKTTLKGRSRWHQRNVGKCAAHNGLRPPPALMSILKCHVTIHYIPVRPYRLRAPQGDSRGNNASTRHIVRPAPLSLSLPPPGPARRVPSTAHRPKTFGFLRQLVIPRARLSNANWICICPFVLPGQDKRYRSLAGAVRRLFARHETAVYLFLGQYF